MWLLRISHGTHLDCLSVMFKAVFGIAENPILVQSRTTSPGERAWGQAPMRRLPADVTGAELAQGGEACWMWETGQGWLWVDTAPPAQASAEALWAPQRPSVLPKPSALPQAAQPCRFPVRTHTFCPRGMELTPEAHPTDLRASRLLWEPWASA